MTTSHTAKRLERWVWICIYAGLLLIVAALVAQNAGPAMQAVIWLLVGCGGAALVALGVLLLWLRSRQSA